jgi:hypothetical protein
VYVVAAVVGVAAAFVEADEFALDALLAVCVRVAAAAIVDLLLVVPCWADATCACVSSVVSTTVPDDVPPAAAFITANSGMKLSTLADSTADRIVRYLLLLAFVAIESLSAVSEAILRDGLKATLRAN